jgi:hypothetical protein
VLNSRSIFQRITVEFSVALQWVSIAQIRARPGVEHACTTWCPAIPLKSVLPPILPEPWLKLVHRRGRRNADTAKHGTRLVMCSVDTG